MLEAGVNVNATDSNGFTAVVYAAYMGRTETLRALLDAGADVNLKDVFGRTALVTAASLGRTETVRDFLAAGADVNARDHRGWTALATTCSNTGPIAEGSYAGRSIIGAGPNRKYNGKSWRSSGGDPPFELSDNLAIGMR